MKNIKLGYEDHMNKVLLFNKENKAVKSDHNNILITFIVPFHNTYINDFNKCIESIKQQNINDYEVIVIDDGSDFEYASKLDDIYGEDERIKIMHIKKQGVSSARNQGIQYAKGLFITFVDSDDMLIRNTYREGVNILKQNDLDILVGQISKKLRNDIDDYINYECRNFGKYSIFYSGDKDYINGIFSVTSINKYDDAEWKTILQSPVAKIVKTSVVRDNLFPEGIAISEDTIWNYSLTRNKNLKIGIINLHLYIYVQNSYSVLHEFSEKLSNDVLIAVDSLSKMIEGDGKVSSQYLLWLIGKQQQIVDNYLRPECKMKSKMIVDKLRREVNSGSFRTLYTHLNLLPLKDRLKAWLFKQGIVYYYYKFKKVWHK